MYDDLTLHTAGGHWLGWLGEDPAGAVRPEIEGALRDQVATARLEWLRVVEEPRFLTGGRKVPDNKMIVTRAGLAVAFELQVRSDRGTERLRGVFSWVAVGLDGARRDSVFFDVNTELEWAAKELVARICEIDRSAPPPS